jgi:hypothetical protein
MKIIEKLDSKSETVVFEDFESFRHACMCVQKQNKQFHVVKYFYLSWITEINMIIRRICFQKFLRIIIDQIMQHFTIWFILQVQCLFIIDWSTAWLCDTFHHTGEPIRNQFLHKNCHFKSVTYVIKVTSWLPFI